MTAPLRQNGKFRAKIVTSCSSKNRYSNVETAVAMGLQQEEIYPDKKLFCYRCEVCAGWHITKYPRSPNGTRNRRCSLDEAFRRVA